MLPEAKIAFLAALSSFTWSPIFHIYYLHSFSLFMCLILFIVLHGALAVKIQDNLEQAKVGEVTIAKGTTTLPTLHGMEVIRSCSVAWRAYLLGLFLSVGINISLLASSFWLSTGLYIFVLCTFHLGEYVTTALFNPSSLSLDSFLLNHSFEYNAALIISWIEHGILLYFLPTSECVHLSLLSLLQRFAGPEIWRLLHLSASIEYSDMKTNTWLTYTGLTLCIAGDIFRKAAMYTAGKSFNHIVQWQKSSNHVLVTDGVYGIVRHPSYTGWFCWSVSTQILLLNPICLVGYAVASWKFFNERICYEELTLLKFFGDDYLQYKKRVHSGIPFVSGFEE